MDWKTRIATAFGPTKPDDEVLEELAQHAAATYAAARAEGCEARESERRVAQQIAAWTADPALLRRRPRREPAVVPPAGSSSGLGSVMQDARYAWRLLRRQPAYGALVVATMALGIAATTVLASVAYAVLLKPLPWADAPRLVRLYENRQGSTRRFGPMMTNGTFLAFRDTPSATVDAIEAWSVRNAIVSADGQAQQLRVAGVTPGLLDIVGGKPAMGRLFMPEDAQAVQAAPAAGNRAPGPAFVAIISHGLWQQRFGGRSDVLAQPLRLDGTTYSIVGVMPASFAFPDRSARAWLPFLVRPMTVPNQPGAMLQMFQAIGRARPGATPEQVTAEGTARARTVPTNNAVTMAVFGSSGAVDVTAVPLLKALTDEVRPAIIIMFVAVVLLLATATANIASLQLARATGRRRELAIRSALGAARGRLVRQALVENLLLGVLGGLAGLALAAIMHRALPSILPPDFPRLDDLAFDVRVQAFALVTSLVAGLGCGLLPALHAGRHDLVPALVEDSLAPAGGGVRSRIARARSLIMAGQVAIACVLLVGASLLLRSFDGMMRADVGYDMANVLTARIILPGADYTPERRRQTIDAVIARLRALPEVRHAAFSTVIPFVGGEALSSFPLKKRDGSTATVQTGSRLISAGYFAAMGQKILEGREFTPADSLTSQHVVMVNREFSRKYLEGRALGWSLPGRTLPNGTSEDRPIVGVVEDTVRRSVTDTPQPEIYMASPQQALQVSDLNLILRTTSDPRASVPAIRSILQAAAPGAPLESIMTMEDRLAATLAKPRLYAVLLGTFAAFALAIAGVGLFGVLSYSVAQRAREIGVRSALGAQVRDIVRLVVGQSMVIAGAGVTAGLVASFWLTGALQKFLYGVTPRDAASFVAVAIVLLIVSAIASIVPARRAARVDPVKVLRA
jgi:putative ABC transport system permease protein